MGMCEVKIVRLKKQRSGADSRERLAVSSLLLIFVSLIQGASQPTSTFKEGGFGREGKGVFYGVLGATN